MSGWVRYLKLQATAKTGFGTGVLVWGVLALGALIGTLVFLVFAGFIWLAGRYDPLTAALIIGGAFLLLTIIAGIATVASYRSTVTRAQIELANRKQQPWLDPSFLGIGMQVGRAVGWRRLIPLAALAVFAVGLAKEWTGHRTPPSDNDTDDAA